MTNIDIHLLLVLQYPQYDYERNWELYTTLYTVFDVNVVRSMGQVDEMELDEIGQHEFIFSFVILVIPVE